MLVEMLEDRRRFGGFLKEGRRYSLGSYLARKLLREGSAAQVLRDGTLKRPPGRPASKRPASSPGDSPAASSRAAGESLDQAAPPKPKKASKRKPKPKKATEEKSTAEPPTPSED